MLRVFRKMREYQSVLGFGGLVTFLRALLVEQLSAKHLWPRSRQPRLFQMQWNGIPHPANLRMGTTDPWVLKQVLLDRHYDFSLPQDPKIIVDVGANIGLSAVFFANKYPNATVFALE